MVVGVGLRRIAHPDPHEGVLLHHGEAADAGAVEDVRLAGDAARRCRRGRRSARGSRIAGLVRPACPCAAARRGGSTCPAGRRLRSWRSRNSTTGSLQMRRASGVSPISSAQAATYQALRMNMAVSSCCAVCFRRASSTVVVSASGRRGGGCGVRAGRAHTASAGVARPAARQLWNSAAGFDCAGNVKRVGEGGGLRMSAGLTWW